MDDTRSTRGESRPGTSGVEPARPYVATGQPQENQKSPDDLERDIAHTRAEMSETLNAIEHRLSPAHLKHEAQETLHDTVHHVLDTVQDRLNPKRLARNAGNTMIDTIKENPVPSLIAGLSIGWLLFKSNDADGPADRYEYRRVRPSDRYGYDPSPSLHAYPTQAYREQTRYESGERPAERGWTYREDGNGHSGHSGGVRERVSHVADQAGEQVSHMADQAREHAEDFGRQVYRGARRTTNTLDDFIHDNPLAAGAIAVGIGALLGSFLPSTSQENEWMGEQRDQLVHKAERVAERVMDEAQSSAQTLKETVVDEAKSAAESVKEAAQEEARHVTDAARDEAEQQNLTSRSSQNDGERRHEDQPRTPEKMMARGTITGTSSEPEAEEDRPNLGTSRASI